VAVFTGETLEEFASLYVVPEAVKEVFRLAAFLSSASFCSRIWLTFVEASVSPLDPGSPILPLSSSLGEALPDQHQSSVRICTVIGTFAAVRTVVRSTSLEALLTVVMQGLLAGFRPGVQRCGALEYWPLMVVVTFVVEGERQCLRGRQDEDWESRKGMQARCRIL